MIKVLVGRLVRGFMGFGLSAGTCLGSTLPFEPSNGPSTSRCTATVDGASTSVGFQGFVIRCQGILPGLRAQANANIGFDEPSIQAKDL